VIRSPEKTRSLLEPKGAARGIGLSCAGQEHNFFVGDAGGALGYCSPDVFRSEMRVVCPQVGLARAATSNL